ncbi:MAG: ABC transporter permease subunit [Gemmatimonas sp.]|nr:ABC transporter permease subunit [Gemmatimonas sp.]
MSSPDQSLSLRLSMSRALARIGLRASGVIVALVAWQVVCELGLANLDLVPSPIDVARAFVDLASSGVLFEDAAHTVGATLMGWGIAAVAGVVVGAVLGVSHVARAYASPAVDLFRTFPPIAFVPVALVAVGLSVRLEIVVIVAGCVWPILIGTTDGVRGISAEKHDLARVLRLGRLARIRKIVLPAALGGVMVGLRVGMGLALVLAVTAEMIGNPSGIGYAIVRAGESLHPDRLYAYIVTVGILGVALNVAVVALSERLVPQPRRRQ